MSRAHHELLALAPRQHGVFTYEQALGVGLSRNQVAHGLRSGRYERMGRRGFYRVAGLPVSWESRLMAAVLSGPPGAIASHRSAAHLWGLDGCPRRIVEVSVPRQRRPNDPRGVRTHESTDLDLADPTRHRNIPVTGLDRTLIDLGAVVTRDRLSQAVDDAIRRRLTTWEKLAAVRTRHSRRGRDGVGKLRALLEERYGTTIPDSHFGRLVADLLVTAGLPTPVIEHDVHSAAGVWLARVDMGYPEHKIAIELDSKAHHLHELAFEADRPRQNRLEIEGWLVLRYTWRFYSRSPNRLCNEVAAALRRRRRAA